MMHMYRAAATERGESTEASNTSHENVDEILDQEDAMETWLKNLNFEEYIADWSSLATSISTMDIGPTARQNQQSL